MKIGMITYDSPHLKTEQVLMGLILTGQTEIDIICVPFVARPRRQPLFCHRPDMSSGTHPRLLAEALGLRSVICANVHEIPTNYDYMIVGGAGILPPNIVIKVPIINAHPGLIPTVRGLDSFKWSILDGMPLGVTLHFLDAAVDAGEVVASMRTPVIQTDSIETLARRHYELEITMLSNALTFVASGQPSKMDLPVRQARKRMGIEMEKKMLSVFEEYRDLFRQHY